MTGFEKMAMGTAAAGPPIFSTINTLLQNRANRKMAEYQWSKNLEMWNMQNRYNTPSAQMERFKEAGLNPQLIYGKGTAGNATTLPQYQAPRQEYNFQPPEMLGMLAQYQDVKLKEQQRDNLRAQEVQTQIESMNKALTGSLIRGRIMNQNLQNTYLDKSMKDRLERIQLQNQLTLGQYNTQVTQQALNRITAQGKTYELPWSMQVGTDAQKGLNFKNMNFLQNIGKNIYDWWEDLLNYSRQYNNR